MKYNYELYGKIEEYYFDVLCCDSKVIVERVFVQIKEIINDVGVRYCNFVNMI